MKPGKTNAFINHLSDFYHRIAPDHPQLALFMRWCWRRHVAIVGIVLALFVLVLLVCSFSLFKCTSNSAVERIFIPTGSSYMAVVDSLESHGCVGNATAFFAVASMRNYPSLVKPGSYLVEPHTNYFTLVNKLRSGNQDAVRVTFRRFHTIKHVCGFLAQKLEADSSTFAKVFLDADVCESYGFTPQTIICLFQQNTFDLYWNSTPEKVLDRMKKTYSDFWTPLRQSRAERLNLTQTEVITLASIVEQETNQNDEKEDVASVYLNRLRAIMPLQADPTVKFAVGDFGLRRILTEHLQCDSPYNTYKVLGLPPGPICNPSTPSIDAVLANKSTDYLFFCAKEDFSGHHNFACTLQEHYANAERFHKALNERQIFK